MTQSLASVLHDEERHVRYQMTTEPDKVALCMTTISPLSI